jgi:hypothetical protein
MMDKDRNRLRGIAKGMGVSEAEAQEIGHLIGVLPSPKGYEAADALEVVITTFLGQLDLADRLAVAIHLREVIKAALPEDNASDAVLNREYYERFPEQKGQPIELYESLLKDEDDDEDGR